VQQWLAANQIKTIYIEPGSPWQNGFVESFHGRFRDECLNREQLWTLTEAPVVVGDYRQEYNQLRPHSRLGYETPASFAARTCPSPSPIGLRPPSDKDGQTTQNTTT
jgi:transposase InsO family protein